MVKFIIHMHSCICYSQAWIHWTWMWSWVDTGVYSDLRYWSCLTRPVQDFCLESPGTGLRTLNVWCLILIAKDFIAFFFLTTCPKSLTIERHWCSHVCDDRDTWEHWCGADEAHWYDTKAPITTRVRQMMAWWSANFEMKNHHSLEKREHGGAVVNHTVNQFLPDRYAGLWVPGSWLRRRRSFKNHAWHNSAGLW